MKNWRSMFVILMLLLASGSAHASTAAGEVKIEKGLYRPFFRELGEADRPVSAMWVDRDPVTNAEFAEFLKKNPKWQRQNIPSIFSSKSYLQHWKDAVSFDAALARQPVTNVTWFAARKYCESQGKRLMTVDEWEFVADAQSPENLSLILDWYTKPNQLTDVQKAVVNSRGLRGMHGLIWEWVEDYGSVIIAGDSRDSNDTSKDLFCGAGSLRAKDPSQYATFMRFAYRSSMKANYAGQILGFRCARDVEPNSSK
ncbi:MAG: formylglycine-generating enzyme family protein [Bdellovibrionaceae bacterium]|nr:formylglycine-generating enzyme family protein [Pseudobdellovibrionaceae bacterium]